MNTVIVLAMHGMPPRDFSRQETSELFGLHARLSHAVGPERAALEAREAELDAKMRGWPRTPANDPYWAGSLALAEELARVCGRTVIACFNEFCAPSLDSALDQGAAQADRVVVATPMMTRGGDHSERDIPNAIARARVRHPGVEFAYLWPFQVPAIAQFLADQLAPLI